MSGQSGGRKAKRPDEGSFIFGAETIPFRVDYGKRKHLRIVVEAERGVEVRAPSGTSFSVVRHAVEKRSGWIASSLRKLRQSAREHPKPSYCSGEPHLFLGTPYPLVIGQGSRNLAELKEGAIRIERKTGSSSPEDVKRALTRWYASQTEGVFAASMARCLPRCAAFVASAPPLKARFLRARWGSWSSTRGVTLNTHLLKAPPECIDYVLLHELCHIRHPNHGKGFYELLERVSPDWRALKKRLEETVRLRLFV